MYGLYFVPLHAKLICIFNLMKELVSVVMPTHNGDRFLEDSIRSILAQTYANLELLITDDCSDNNATLEILHRYQKLDPRVDVLYLKENKGPGYARNKSIERAKGRYIAFCDSDDRWFADKLERQLAFMREKDCALCCSSYIVCNEKDENIGIRISPIRITYKMLERDNKIGCLTAIYDIKKLGEKFYMPTLRKRQDWALFLTILKKCRLAYGLVEPLAYYRDRSHSVSSNKFSLVKYNVAVYHEILKFSWVKSYFYFFFIFLPAYTAKLYRRHRDTKRIFGSDMVDNNHIFVATTILSMGIY